MTPSPELTILRYLTRRRDGATAQQVGSACAMAQGEVRGCLSAMESRRLVFSRHDAEVALSRQVYCVTEEGGKPPGA